MSLFDKKVAWGWNLRHLGCMLQDPQFDVPDIPGVFASGRPAALLLRFCAGVLLPCAAPVLLLWLCWLVGCCRLLQRAAAAAVPPSTPTPSRLPCLMSCPSCLASLLLPPGVTSPMCYFGMWKSFFGW